MSQVFLGMPSIQAQGQAHTGGWVTNVSTPQDALRWGHTFPEGAHRALANTQMRRNLGHATRTIRAKRGQRVRPPRRSSSRSPRACPSCWSSSRPT